MRVAAGVLLLFKTDIRSFRFVTICLLLHGRIFCVVSLGGHSEFVDFI